MITLLNCVLKNTNGYYSSLQDEEMRFYVSIYHLQLLSTDLAEVIFGTVTNDFKRKTLTYKSKLFHYLEAKGGKEAANRNFSVKHYSVFLHESKKVSAIICLGEDLSYYGLRQLRAEFPEAYFAVYKQWECAERRNGEWYLYNLIKLYRHRFTVVMCKNALPMGELYMIISAYKRLKSEKDDERVTAEKLNLAITEMAKVEATSWEIRLPWIESIQDGSALLEMVVSYNQNYFLAED